MVNTLAVDRSHGLLAGLQSGAMRGMVPAVRGAGRGGVPAGALPGGLPSRHPHLCRQHPAVRASLSGFRAQLRV